MRCIIGYLLFLLMTILASLVWIMDIFGFLSTLGTQCSLFGAIGGIVYCLRAIYINKCVKKQWDEIWHVWYYLRPIVSGIMGGISYLFLKSGLLVLDATQDSSNGGEFGFLALSFVAGYNVDRFLIRIEQIVESVWGIKMSRASEDSSRSKGEGKWE